MNDYKNLVRKSEGAGLGAFAGLVVFVALCALLGAALAEVFSVFVQGACK